MVAHIKADNLNGHFQTVHSDEYSTMFNVLVEK